MTTALVLSGGASLGSIQVGMATALAEAGIEPDLIVGSSVGAINGAWLASGHPPGQLAQVWRNLRRSELFPLRPLVGLRGFMGRRSHLIPNSGLRRLLERHMGFAHLEDAPLSFTVIATDARSGEEVTLRTGPCNSGSFSKPRPGTIRCRCT